MPPGGSVIPLAMLPYYCAQVATFYRNWSLHVGRLLHCSLNWTTKSSFQMFTLQSCSIRVLSVGLGIQELLFKARKILRLWHSFWLIQASLSATCIKHFCQPILDRLVPCILFSVCCYSFLPPPIHYLNKLDILLRH